MRPNWRDLHVSLTSNSGGKGDHMLGHLFSWFRGALLGVAVGAILAGGVFTLSAVPVSSLFQSGALASYFGGQANQYGDGSTVNTEGSVGALTPKPSPGPTTTSTPKPEPTPTPPSSTVEPTP